MKTHYRNIYEQAQFEKALQEKVQLKLGAEDFSGTLSELKDKIIQLKTESKLSEQELKSQEEIIKWEFFKKLKSLYGNGYSDEFYRSRSWYIINNKSEEIHWLYDGKEVKTKWFSFMENAQIKTYSESEKSKENNAWGKLKWLNDLLYGNKDSKFTWLMQLLQSNDNSFKETLGNMQWYEYALSVVLPPTILVKNYLQWKTNEEKIKNLIYAIDKKFTELSEDSDVISSQNSKWWRLSMNKSYQEIVSWVWSKNNAVADILKDELNQESKGANLIYAKRLLYDESLSKWLELSKVSSKTGENMTEGNIIIPIDQSLDELYKIHLDIDEWRNGQYAVMRNKQYLQKLHTDLFQRILSENGDKQKQKQQIIKLVCIMTWRMWYYQMLQNPNSQKDVDGNIIKLDIDNIFQNSWKNTDHIDDDQTDFENAIKILDQTLQDENIFEVVLDELGMWIPSIESSETYNGVLKWANRFERLNNWIASLWSWEHEGLKSIADTYLQALGGKIITSRVECSVEEKIIYTQLNNFVDSIYGKIMKSGDYTWSMEIYFNELSTDSAKQQAFTAMLSNANIEAQGKTTIDFDVLKKKLNPSYRSLENGKWSKDFSWWKSIEDRHIFDLYQSIVWTGKSLWDSVMQTRSTAWKVLTTLVVTIGATIATAWFAWPGLAGLAIWAATWTVAWAAADQIINQTWYGTMSDAIVDRWSEIIIWTATWMLGWALAKSFMGWANAVSFSRAWETWILKFIPTAWTKWAWKNILLWLADRWAGVWAEYKRINYLDIVPDQNLKDVLFNPVALIWLAMGLANIKTLSKTEHTNLLRNINTLKRLADADPSIKTKSVEYIDVRWKKKTTTVGEILESINTDKPMKVKDVNKIKSANDEYKKWAWIEDLTPEARWAKAQEIINNHRISKGKEWNLTLNQDQIDRINKIHNLNRDQLSRVIEVYENTVNKKNITPEDEVKIKAILDEESTWANDLLFGDHSAKELAYKSKLCTDFAKIESSESKLLVRNGIIGYTGSKSLAELWGLLRDEDYDIKNDDDIEKIKTKQETVEKHMEEIESEIKLITDKTRSLTNRKTAIDKEILERKEEIKKDAERDTRTKKLLEDNEALSNPVENPTNDPSLEINIQKRDELIDQIKKETEYKEMKRKLAEKKKELEKKKKSLADKRGELDWETNKEKTDAKKNTSKHGSSAIDEAFKKIETLKHKFTTLWSLVDIIKTKFDFTKDNINAINNKIELWKKIIKDLEHEQTILGSEIPNLNSKIDEKNRKQEWLKRNREEVNKSMAQNNRTLVTMQWNNRTGSETPEITQQKELIRKNNEEIANYDKQIAQMDLEIDDLTSKLDKTRTKKWALDAEIKQKNEDFQNEINNIRMKLLQEYEEQINDTLNSIKSTSKIDITNFDSDLEELSLKDLQTSIQVIESNFWTWAWSNTWEIWKIWDELFPLFSSDLNDSNRNTPNTTARFNAIKLKIEAARSDYDRHKTKLQSILGKKKTSEIKMIDAESEFSNWEADFNRIHWELIAWNIVDPKEIEELERKFKALESDHKSELKNIKLKEKDPEVIIWGKSHRPSKFIEDLEAKRKQMESIKDIKKRITLEKLIDNDTAWWKWIEQDIVDFNNKVDNPNDETFHQGKIKELEKKIDDLQSTVNSQWAMELKRPSGETYEKYLANCRDRLKKIKDKWEMKTYEKYKQAMDEYEVLKKAAWDTVDWDEKRILNEKMDEVRNRKKIYEDANAQYLDKKWELNTQFNKIEPKHNDFIWWKLSRWDLVDNTPDVLSKFVNDFHLNATLSTTEWFDQHILSRLHGMNRDEILEAFADVHAMEILLRSGYFDTPRGKFSPEQRSMILARNERIKQIIFTRLNDSIIENLWWSYKLSPRWRKQLRNLHKYFITDHTDWAIVSFLWKWKYPKLKKKYTSAWIHELTEFANKIDSGYMTLAFWWGVDFNEIRRKMSEEAKDNATTWHNENSWIGSKDGGKDAQWVTVDVRSRSNKAVERLMNGWMVRKAFGRLFKWFIESERIQTWAVVWIRIITGDVFNAFLDWAILNPLTNNAAWPLTRWVIFWLTHYGAPTLLEWIKEEWNEWKKIETLAPEVKLMIDALTVNPEYAKDAEKDKNDLIDNDPSNDADAKKDLERLYKKSYLDKSLTTLPNEMKKYLWSEDKMNAFLDKLDLEWCKNPEQVKQKICEYEFAKNKKRYLKTPFDNIRQNIWIIDYIKTNPEAVAAAKDECKSYRNNHPNATLQDLKNDKKRIAERLSDSEINLTRWWTHSTSSTSWTPEASGTIEISDAIKAKLKSNFEKIWKTVNREHPDGNIYSYDGRNFSAKKQ